MIPMVLIATASPCKFQYAVEVALGKDGWKEWEENLAWEKQEIKRRKAEGFYPNQD